MIIHNIHVSYYEIHYKNVQCNVPCIMYIVHIIVTITCIINEHTFIFRIINMITILKYAIKVVISYWNANYYNDNLTLLPNFHYSRLDFHINRCKSNKY